MEREKERVKKVELIQKAIDQLQSKTCHLLDESFVAVDVDDEARHRHQLLSQLLTQVFYFYKLSHHNMT